MSVGKAEIESYDDALHYLYSFADYERNRPREYAGQHLSNARLLLAALDNPQDRLRLVHVAGTKGKGSTSAFISSVLVQAGYRVGLYTSPHLHTHRERYRLDGEPISQETFTRHIRELATVIPKLQPDEPFTTYELSTALAFKLFADASVDVAIIEVGLGGRLDATNVIRPLVSVITAISIDHAEVLGKTLSAIAGEKAGIIKPGVPVVIARQPPEALERILSVAAEVGSEAIQVAQVVQATHPEIHGGLQTFELETSLALGGQPLNGLAVELPLIGRHQIDNALAAITTCSVLDQQGLSIDRAALLEGLRAVRWPARFEVVEGAPPIVIDGAHNPDSIARLRSTVDAVFPRSRSVYVFGCGKGHDARGMLRELTGEQLVLTQSMHPRSVPVDTLGAIAEELRIRHVTGSDVAEALARARELSLGEPVVVCGSLFVAAEAREVLGLPHETDAVRS